MSTSTQVIITGNNEFETKDTTVSKTINLEAQNQWRIKDHTEPKDVKVTLPAGAGTMDHNQLYNRDMSDQHPISAITGLQSALDAKIDSADLSIICCGTSTEVT